MPISRVRCETRYAITPYRPTLASISAVKRKDREEQRVEPLFRQRA